MSISILDSQRNETVPQLFTKPLRAVLGGRQFFYRNDQDANPQSKAILAVWQRALVAIVLLTVALPYTFLATLVLAGTALLSSQKTQNHVSAQKTQSHGWLTEQDRKALSAIFTFDGSLIVLTSSIVGIANSQTTNTGIDNYNGWVDEEHFEAAIQNFIYPTWMKVVLNNTCADYLVIPVFRDTKQLKDAQTDQLVDVWKAPQKTFCVISKHPNDTGPEAAWHLQLDKTSIHIPLYKEPNLEEIQPFKDLMAGRRVEIKDEHYLFFVATTSGLFGFDDQESGLVQGFGVSGLCLGGLPQSRRAPENAENTRRKQFSAFPQRSLWLCGNLFPV